MHVNVEDVPGKEIAPGVVERWLMSYGQGDPEGRVSARHYTLSQGATLALEEPMTEWQHYIISGSAAGGGGDMLTADTAVFMPAGAHDPVDQAKGLRRHGFTQTGEGELRIFTVACRVTRPAFRWAKSRVRHLLSVPTPHQTSIGYTQIFTEEEHAIMGALRFHAVDIQTHPPGQHKGRVEGGRFIGHRNPAEIMFFLRGSGKAMAEAVLFEVRPGSLAYTGEGTLHGIWNPDDNILEYICLELIEHDKSWTERGYQGETNPPPWT